MKKFLKILAAILGLLGFALLILIWVKNEPLPQIKKSGNADALAQKMLTALNHGCYVKTQFLEWSYRNGAHKYKWDKKLGMATVQWDDHKVILDLAHNHKSKLVTNGKPLPAKKARRLIEKALRNFNNDSFWLVAPYKVFDEGTERGIVTLKDGSEVLMVTYTSGGTTPGDSYLWILHKNGFPSSYKMWVKIIPIGGMEASWDDWTVGQSGVFLPKSHKLGPLTLSMGDVKGYTGK